ncbi:hypothetical protein PFISCL1PPCAC_21246, partial [Pristionchus fissidentatus]
MESEGTLRILEELIYDGISISTRVGDQNLMVNKALRENDKTAGILDMLDWWHVQKPFRKEWKKVVKANPELAPVYQSFFNHLYYAHNKFPNHEDRSRALELVRSFEHHIQGKHSWAKDKMFTMVKKCAHGRLRKLKKGETRLKLTKESGLIGMVVELLYSPKFEKAFLSAASLIDTAMNECFHSLSLMYAAKRFACSPMYYRLKTKVALLHYNGLVLEDMMGTRKEAGNTMLQRPGKAVIAVKRKKELGTHDWRGEIMNTSYDVREENNDKQFARRIGMPEDDVYDELNVWWEEKERDIRAMEEYERDEGEESEEDDDGEE